VTVQRTVGTAKRAVVVIGVSLRSGRPKYISRDPLNEDVRARRRCNRDP